MKKIFLLLCLFFICNTPELNSNCDKELYYEKNKYEENNYKIYFINTNSNELKNIIPNLDIRILSYIIDNEKYYARNIDELLNIYISDMNLSNKIYYEKNGIQIDGINVMCNTYELEKLENYIDIF